MQSFVHGRNHLPKITFLKKNKIMTSYETVIGLEIHIQLSTQSKAFCGDSTTFGASPNTQVSAISLAHPGTLPRLNKKQIEYAVKLGLALDSKISPISYFDRKNYFYADLPKGYQITQDRLPICIGGALVTFDGNEEKSFRIHHIHMEEDAGKSIHNQDPKYSLIDLNRAGVPLLEIVTEPDMRSPKDVEDVMTNMRQLVRYLGISDGNMEEGSMRCDVNISVRKKGATEYGNRCEVKNVNSMKFAKKAIEYEVKRQINILENGGSIEVQTLNFNPETGVTTPLRNKEEAKDYRYFPEPDLPPVVLTDEYVQEIKSKLVQLPRAVYLELKDKYKLSEYDANLLSQERTTADYFKNLVGNLDAKPISNLIINKILPFCKEKGISIDDFPVSNDSLRDFVHLILDDKVSNSMAYQRLFPKLLSHPNENPLDLAEKLDLIQSNDSGNYDALIMKVINDNPDKVKAYQNGKKGLIGFFMGQIMRASGGKVNPKVVQGLLEEILN